MQVAPEPSTVEMLRHLIIALTEEISSDVLCVGFSFDKDGHMSLSVSAYYKNILGHI